MSARLKSETGDAIQLWAALGPDHVKSQLLSKQCLDLNVAKQLQLKPPLLGQPQEMNESSIPKKIGSFHCLA